MKKAENEARLLAEGDIIRLKAGHVVYFDIPEHFCYTNRLAVFDKLAQAVITIGLNHHGLETDFLAGKYVVTRTGMGGGGTGHGPGDIYPNGWNVRAQFVGRPWQIVEFYQSGCFTAMNENVPVVGRANQKWEVE